MHFKLMFPSNYLSAFDLQGREATVEIESVNIEDLVMTGGKKQKKGLIRFKGKQKAMVLNKTNALTIAAQYGNETDNWLGKKITVFPTTTTFGRDTVECLRVK